MLSEDEWKIRQTLWDYFSLHADQRLRSFNFYLILSAIIIGAFINSVKGSNVSQSSAVLPFLLTVASYVFWKLDERTKLMIKNAENGIKILERTLLDDHSRLDDAVCIFLNDDKDKPLRKTKAIYSYSDCFNILFTLFGILGFIAGVISILLGN